MNDEKNDKPVGSPPPLVPPVVRKDSDPYDAPVASDSSPSPLSPDRTVVREPGQVNDSARRDEAVAPVSEHAAHDHASVRADRSEDDRIEPNAHVAATPDPDRVQPERVHADRVDDAPVPTAVVPAYAPTPVPTHPPVPAQQQRVFVSAPVQPKRRGNRAIGSLIAVLSVIVFAVLYAVVSGVIIAIAAPAQPVMGTVTRFLSDPVFYVPAILFVIGFVLVVLLVNRANWWAYVLGSLVVAAIVYFGTIGIQLLTENVFAMTAQEAGLRFVAYASNPFVIAAALVAREVSIWIGSAISARGRRIKARNLAARSDYDRAVAEHRAEYERSYQPTA